jgi:hypothetical protein
LRRQQADEQRRRASRFAGLLAGLILLAGVAGAVLGGDALDLHNAARTWSWVSVPLLALAGAMALERRRALRRASAMLALAVFFFTYLGSPSFLNRFVGDPFLAPAPVVAVTTVSPSPLAEVSLPFEVSSLSLSPAGSFRPTLTPRSRPRCSRPPWLA